MVSDKARDLYAFYRYHSDDPRHPSGGCNFYRRDDVSATVYFYLDRPENDLPPLASAEVRVQGLADAVPR